MTVKVSINGFGRIGRNVLRAIVESGRTRHRGRRRSTISARSRPTPICCAIDSVHGRFPGVVTVAGDTIDVGAGPIKVTAIKDPAELPHAALGVDIALECTGIFTARDKAAAHLTAGAKRVLVSAPSDGADLTVVYRRQPRQADQGPSGRLQRLLHDQLPRAGRQGAQRRHRHRARLHDDDPFLHRRPADARHDAQGPLSRPRGGAVDDPDLDRRGQGGGPGAARTQWQARRLRHPRADAECLGRRPEIRRQARDDARTRSTPRSRRRPNGPLKGILGYTDQKNVSIDFNHDPPFLDLPPGPDQGDGRNAGSVLSWYDNEWGFSNRMADTAVALAKLI